MENMRQLLRGSLGRSLSTMPVLDRLAAAWPVACGPAMARRGVVTSLEAGILLVVVEDAAWRDQMRAMRGVLQEELSRIAEVKLAGIHFELKKAVATHPVTYPAGKTPASAPPGKTPRTGRPTMYPTRRTES